MALRRILPAAVAAIVLVASAAFGASGEPSKRVAGNAAVHPASPSAVPTSGVLDAGASAPSAAAEYQKMLGGHCSACHNDRAKTAGFTLSSIDAANIGSNLPMWEKVLRRVSLGEMPPKGMPRPPKEQLHGFTNWLGQSLDSWGHANPDPGYVSLHRLNRTQYATAVRDLLDLDVDITRQLPADDSAFGFDNIAELLTISPTLIDRYLVVAGKVSRLATGQASTLPEVSDYRVPKDAQVVNFGIPAYLERADDDLPAGSRGGGVFRFYAPYDATYAIQVYVNAGSATERETGPDNRLEFRVPLKAGLRKIGASFRKPATLDEVLIPRLSVGVRPGSPKTDPVPLPLTVQVDGVPVKQFEVSSHATGPNVIQGFFPRDVIQISVNGPFEVVGPGDTPALRRVFICQPSRPSQEKACARKILNNLAHRAFRRPVNTDDITPLMAIYEQHRKKSDFRGGIGAALQALLVAPDFLMVRDESKGRAAPGQVEQLSDLSLATRLSLFLWSSIPDEELLRVAEAGKLSQPAELETQVRRMLADPKSRRLVENFAGDWLFLRRLQIQRPDHDIFPEFSQPLRAAMRTETETFFMGILRENRSILDFIDADYSYLNQPLAEFYGIRGVYGDAFRKVKLDAETGRGGLLGQGAVLMATSYNNRTSVVLRGKWVLEQLLGAGPPPPPADVPSLTETKNGAHRTLREQMEEHRANPVCASCHNKMDPLGFSLENFNAIGQWRDRDAGKPLDTSGILPDGTQFEGPQGLKTILLARKEQFVDTFIEMLTTYATGREVVATDRPFIRQIRYTTAPRDYPMQEIVLGIIRSPAFSAQRLPKRQSVAETQIARKVTP